MFFPVSLHILAVVVCLPAVHITVCVSVAPDCVVAVIVTVPAFFPVTVPPLTVATLVSLELHETCALSLAVAVNVIAFPTLTEVAPLIVTVGAATQSPLAFLVYPALHTQSLFESLP